GDGIIVSSSTNTEPVGSNNPFTSTIFQIWSDSSSASSHIWLLGTSVPVASPMSFHTYRLERVGDVYSAYIDGTLAVGGASSTARVQTIMLGNATSPCWYQPSAWTGFSADYVRVTTSGLYRADPALYYGHRQSNG